MRFGAVSDGLSFGRSEVNSLCKSKFYMHGICVFEGVWLVLARRLRAYNRLLQNPFLESRERFLPQEAFFDAKPTFNGAGWLLDSP